MNHIFFDTEFTGLHQRTTLMSIGLIDMFGNTFYAELTDYDQSQVNDWIRDNVVANFTLGKARKGDLDIIDDDISGSRATFIRGTKRQVKTSLIYWLAVSDVRSGPIQMWSDCLAYDWVLFNDLLADYNNGYPELPAKVDYIPMDICTLFYTRGIDADISREQYAGFGSDKAAKHNALHDARVIRECYLKLVRERAY